MGEVVSKGEFAGRIGVSPGRVSQYIAQGKLSGGALVGEGRSARIDVDVALAQLRGRLDVNQRLGLNGIATRLDGPPQTAPAAAADLPPIDPVEDRIKREKLRQAEMTTARMERDERASTGEYMRAADAREEMIRLAGTLLTVFEGALPDFAGAIAARFGVANRDVVHLLKGEFRKVRERAATARKEAAADEPETVEDRTDED